MSTLEAVPKWISVPDLVAPPAPAVEAPKEAHAPMPVGVFSLRQIVDSAVTRAEAEAIRRALVSTLGNKSQAARLLGLTRNALRYRLTQMGLES